MFFLSFPLAVFCFLYLKYAKSTLAISLQDSALNIQLDCILSVIFARHIVYSVSLSNYLFDSALNCQALQFAEAGQISM
jgi:hypothetical protein